MTMRKSIFDGTPYAADTRIDVPPRPSVDIPMPAGGKPPKELPAFTRVTSWREFERVIEQLYEHTPNMEALDYLTVMMVGGLAGYIQREIDKHGEPQPEG